jgi:hypothetical protein
MAYQFPKETTYGREIPNWLASEVGMITKTAMLTPAMGETVNGRKIVKSGSVFAGTGLKGLVFGDADVTDGDIEFAVLVAGRVYENRLPATVAENKTELEASGIVFVTAPEVTRV